MHTSSNSGGSRSPRTSPPSPQLLQLLDFLLSDAATDVAVVARELGLRDEMVARLRCALDRITCAQEIVEAIVEDVRGSEKGGCLGGTGHSLGCHGSNVAGRRQERTKARVRSAFELLRNGWPRNYPDEAVEWLIFES